MPSLSSAPSPNSANELGKLKFNAVNKDFTSAAGSGSKVNVAIVTFKTLSAFKANQSAVITGLLKKLVDINQVTLASGTDARARDASGLTFSGTVSSIALKVVGTLTRSSDAQLYYWKPITGVADNVQLQVTGVRNDMSLVELSADPGTTYSVNVPEILSVSKTGLATAIYNGTITIVICIVATNLYDDRRITRHK